MMNRDLCLKYLETPQNDGEADAPIVIFLHGRAANELDLFDLAPQITSKFRVLSPRAPIGMGNNCYGWFHTQYTCDGPVYDPQECESSRQLLIKFIEVVKCKYKVSSKNIILFGFSQGAIMSFGVALEKPTLVGGIACLSGRILSEHIPCNYSGSDFQGFPILLSHGLSDEVLPIHYARAAKDILAQLPIDLTYHEYPMGHDVTDINFSDVRKWLLARAVEY